MSKEQVQTIERAYRVRVRFTRAQMRLLRRLLGAKRFVWNLALRRKNEAVHDAGMGEDRRRACPACGVEHDRDLNAAKNLEMEGWRLLALQSTARSAGINARGEDACAADKTSSAGQPTSMNREETLYAERRSPFMPGLEPGGEGGG